MARTVADAAALLAAMVGPDPRDPATAAASGAAGDYTACLDPGGLRGARLGVVRGCAGFHDRVDRLLEDCLDAVRRLGAEVIDPVEIATLGQFDDAEMEVLLYEFKTDLGAYLAGLGPQAPVRSLADLISFNDQHRDAEMPHFGQELFLQAQEKGPLTSPEYLQALEKCQRLARAEGIDATLARSRLDALVAPTGGPAWLTDWINGDHGLGGCSSPAAVAGYPHVTVPAGFVCGLPVGVSLFGAAFQEPTLIRMAYALEQEIRARRPPGFAATAGLGG
jgi:amidase